MICHFLHFYFITLEAKTTQPSMLPSQTHDFTAASKINEFKLYRDKMQSIGPKFGYFPKAEKSSLIIKHQYESNTMDIFKDSNVQITVTGQRHLGAVIGSLHYKNEFDDNKVASLTMQLKLLSKIEENEPQAAYSAFVAGFKGKLNHMLRTIPEIKEHLLPIENMIRNDFIPTFAGCRHYSNL